MLNSQSPIPLYHQLADILTEQIKSGKYTPGDLIPSETGMAKTYGIGRPTVRQAMDILVRKKLVQRKRGAGTFVKEPDPKVDLFSLAGTSQAFNTQGIKTTINIRHAIYLKQIKQDPDNPFNQASAFYLSRITQVDGDPVLLEDIYLHPELFLGLDKINLENKSLSQVVSDHYYLKPDTGRQTFKVCFLNKKKAALLGLGKSDPILEVQRTLDFPDAKESVFSRLYCRTDRFAFSQTIGLDSEKS
ncbi:MAG: GntR family transcriptional regulator [Desulfobacula sp.]|nr:GntR family transcriptional regulator [Desulfobacula sp.]